MYMGISKSKTVDLNAFSEASAELLGIKTKSSSPSTHDFQVTSSKKSDIVRQERYQLARASRSIYAAAGKAKGLDFVLNYHKSSKCAYIAHSNVNVHVAYEHNRAFLSGVVACGSVHTCPICAAKVEERRRLEVAQGMNFWYSQPNKTVHMLTFTFSHSIAHTLKGVLDKQAKALDLLRSGKAWQNMKDVFGFDSLIRSLEVTWSPVNGFHPHTHELWCVDKVVDRDRVVSYLKARFRAKKHVDLLSELLGLSHNKLFHRLVLDRWEQCCEKVGLMVKPDGTVVDRDAFRKRAVDVHFNAHTSDYLLKQDSSGHWGADREMSKASTKSGRKKGMHPFNFLANYAEKGSRKSRWADLWLEYSKAIHEKRRLYWSPDLKKRVGLEDYTDEQLAELKDEYAVTVYQMTKTEWEKARHNVPKVLQDAEKSKDIKQTIANLEPLPAFDDFELPVVVDMPQPKPQNISLNEICDKVMRGQSAKDFYVRFKQKIEYERNPLIKLDYLVLDGVDDASCISMVTPYKYKLGLVVDPLSSGTVGIVKTEDYTPFQGLIPENFL